MQLSDRTDLLKAATDKSTGGNNNDQKDSGPLSHRRTKSHLGLSRLSTFASKHTPGLHSGSGTADSESIRSGGGLHSPAATSSPTSSYFSNSASSPTSAVVPGDSLLRSTSKLHKKTPSVTGSLGHGSSTSLSYNLASNSSVTSISDTMSTASTIAPSTGTSMKNMSIEDSVRTFRLFEALRNGDTTAIHRAMREASVSTDSTGPEVHSILQLAVQCAETQVIQFVLSSTSRTPEVATEGKSYLDVNYRDPSTGNTALHLAATLGRLPIVAMLLREPGINDAVSNASGMQPVDVARSAEIAHELQLARGIYLEDRQKELMDLLAKNDYVKLESFLETPRTRAVLDLNTLDGGVSGSTLLHEAAKNKDLKLIQILLLHGADPFRRDRKGKLPQDVTKDEKTRSVLKRSPAAVAAQQSIQEKAVLGSGAGIPGTEDSHKDGINKEGREMKGYLKKWTNYTGGYKLRWFVLENGVLSYYKHQDDTESACRGAINMKIARLHADAQDKLKFEIHGKSSVRYHLKANHQVEAKRWIWALNSSIRHAKDEEKAEERQKQKAASQLQAGRAAVISMLEGETPSAPIVESSGAIGRRDSAAYSTLSRSGTNFSAAELEDLRNLSDGDRYDRRTEAEKVAMEDEDDDAFDDNASYAGKDDMHNADTMNLTANSAKLQLDLLAHVCDALTQEGTRNPNMPISTPTILSALGSCDAAVKSLRSLMGDLLMMNRERDSYWRHKLDKEVAIRNMWEENMTRLAVEQEVLEGRMCEVVEKRKRTKRALREALRDGSSPGVRGERQEPIKNLETAMENVDIDASGNAALRRKSVLIQQEMSDSEDQDASDEEFFDAVDTGEVEVIRIMPATVPISISQPVEAPKPIIPVEEAVIEEKVSEPVQNNQVVAIKQSFAGYDHKPRFKFDKAADDRPKISLWGILKSMIGKDMTKMTLPVSFNECTSLLQRVAEDMEYTDLLDMAVERTDSTERLVYVAAFAASEYASTINRVAKPFNPLLGETYEYCRPDKGFRFFVEQVSHHPPIGAAWAESQHWDYYGESSVRSKFYGKSFDINPLGTWFLRLRPKNGGPEELYTWKKVNTAVVGIITGSPTVDNYGEMIIKNHTTGETCTLDFKARGWRGAGAFEVKGRVIDSSNTQRWSIGGRWNDKLYARLSPGYDAAVLSSSGRHESVANAAFLVWEAHDRPAAPFNLTPFAISLNYLPSDLKPHLCPTDTRLRPDQRAMEDGQYDFAATEKHRLEELQRARRRDREQSGEEYVPRWFSKTKCQTTGEEFWLTNGEYWQNRSRNEWTNVQDIFGIGEGVATEVH